MQHQEASLVSPGRVQFALVLERQTTHSFLQTLCHIEVPTNSLA